MSAPSPHTPEAPLWPHCAHGADPATDPVGCPGVHVPGHTACLAHLADADRDAYLAGLTPGADIDHRGTSFTGPLLNALLDAFRDPATGHPRLGQARFDSAIFQGDTWWFGSAVFQSGAWFESATFGGDVLFESVAFEGDVWFGSATFQGVALFESATFGGGAGFGSAIFQRDAWFESATFRGPAWFGSATFRSVALFNLVIFQSDAGFKSATFESGAWFGSATFGGGVGFESVTFRGGVEFESVTFQGGVGFESAIFQGAAMFRSATFGGGAGFGSVTFQGDTWFELATFLGDIGLESAVFERWVSLGPFVCAGRVWLSGAVFNGPANLSFAARRLECRRTRWLSTAELRLRYATVDFAHAVFEYPLTIAGEPDPFMLTGGRTMEEQALAHAPDAAVRIATLRGVDAAHLVLADVDLSRCLFTGTVHLDQLRLEGACAFDAVPPGTHRRRGRPVRFTGRRTLAEEHHWRAKQPDAVRGWNVAVLGAGHAGPAQLAPVYRALRKAFEDGKNEPGAADFYYGEMEMRRHDRTGTSRAERGLLHAYWMLSGYGLRAVRALGWLAAAMLVTVVLLMGFGLPEEDPKQEAAGTVPPGGGRVTFEIEKGDPRNPTGDRFIGERFEKALNVTLNSVVFRSSGQDLTTAGTYIEMASRFVEPTLLALAVLAIRGRVKR
ncbi:pentapeptide repeat-containing protein [Streptomyces sp. S1A]|uniref:pentapeptide repeat-containing protein n=1 Tax=Streptomyces sp. ICN903 TaxID=2964654 RepID=UPI001EDA09B6|nr:pentapeptide repeat-containing protein [Streptomyces sp. ICN903]MCG3043347.1 pentapeptide repeat-containing protein [Streptomyces sp. ICN903]